MDQVSLTSSQKSKIQNQKQLYVLLRSIHFVQKYYNYQRIDTNTYKTQIQKLLEKYHRFSQLIPNHSLQSYCKKFNIPNEQISWAKLLIQKGSTNKNTDIKTFMEVIAKFIEVIDTLSANSQNPSIQILKNPLQHLCTLLSKVCDYFKNYQFTQKYQKFQKMVHDYVSTRSINQCLTQNQFKQISNIVEGLYLMVQSLQ